MNICIDDEKAALMRAMVPDGNAAPVATPDMLCAGFQWLLAKTRQELAERPAGARLEWVRISDIMRMYNVSESAARAWVEKLKALKKVQVQNPITNNGGKGDTFYNLADIQAAFTENALSYGQGKN